MSGFVMNIEVRYEDDEGHVVASNCWAADGDTAAECNSIAESVLGWQARRWMDEQEGRGR